MILAWFFFICEGLICRVFRDSVASDSALYETIIIFVNAIVVYGSVSKTVGKKYRQAIILAFIIRLFLLFWDLNCRRIFVLPLSGYDTEGFARWARVLFLTGENPRGTAYPKFILLWYRLFGVQRALAQYVNILLGISSIIILLRILESINVDKATISKTIKFICILPNFAILNSILLRESLIIFLISVSCFYFVKWFYYNRSIHLVLGIIAVFLASLQHSGAIGVAVGEAIVLVLFKRNTRSFQFSAKSVLLGLCAVLGFLLVFTRYQDVFFVKFSAIDSIEDVVDTAARYQTGGSAYFVGVPIGNSLLNIIVNTPIRFFYFFASPLPWDFRGISDIIAFFFSSLVYISIFLSVYKKLKKREGNNQLMIALLIIVLCAGFVFCWGTSNAGTAMRHREKFITIFMLLFALCKNKNGEKMGTGESCQENVIEIGPLSM